MRVIRREAEGIGRDVEVWGERERDGGPRRRGMGRERERRRS